MSNELAKQGAESAPIASMKGLTELFQTRQKALGSFIPQGSALTFERLLKIVVTACQRNPQLLQCTRESVWLAVTRAVELGLEPGSALGHAHLVPFFNGRSKRHECTLIVGYTGLLELVQRGGKVRNVYAQVVYENDEYDVSFGTDYRLTHRPYLKGDRGAPVFGYSVAIFEDGTTDFEVMTLPEVEKRRKVSRAGKNDDGSAKGVWAEWADEMVKKTVLRRHCKRLPMAIERAERLAEVETDAVIGEFAELVEQAPAIENHAAPQLGARTSQLEAQLAGKPVQQEEPVLDLEPTVNGTPKADPETGEVAQDPFADDAEAPAIETRIAIDYDSPAWNKYCHTFGHDENANPYDVLSKDEIAKLLDGRLKVAARGLKLVVVEGAEA